MPVLLDTKHQICFQMLTRSQSAHMCIINIMVTFAKTALVCSFWSSWNQSLSDSAVLEPNDIGKGSTSKCTTRWCPSWLSWFKIVQLWCMKFIVDIFIVFMGFMNKLFRPYQSTPNPGSFSTGLGASNLEISSSYHMLAEGATLPDILVHITHVDWLINDG